MLDRAFEVAVVFSAVDHVTRPMQQMAGQMGVLDQRSQELQQRMNGFRNMTFVGGAITMAGAALVGKMEDGLDKAGEFLSKMVTIKDTVNATADQMDRIQKTIRTSSGQTIFGVMETADYAKKLATSGYAANQVEDLLPLFTQYAEVQKLGKGSDPAQAIQEAIGAAHSVGAYDPAQVKDFLNKFNKGTFMQPGSSTEFADTFKYLAPIGSGLGVSSDDMITLSALTNRMGLSGSMGGTNAADMVLRSIPGLLGGKTGSKKDSRQVAALKNMGLDGKIFDQQGKFMGVENFIEQLQAASKGKSPTEIAKNYHDIFGMQGMRLADLLSTKNGQEQLDAVVKQMKEMKSIQEQQHDQNQSPLGQMLQLKTNVENLKLGVWLELAKIMNPLFKGMNAFVTKVQEFSDANPRVSEMIAKFMLLSAAVLLIIGPLLLLVGTIGYLSTAGIMGTGFTLLGMAIKSALGPISLVIAAGYLLYQAWQTDFGGIREKGAAFVEWVSKEIPIAVGWLHTMAKALGMETSKGFTIPPWLKMLMMAMVGGKTIGLAFTGVTALKGLFTGGSLLTKLLAGSIKGITGLGKILFGGKAIDLAKWIGIKGFNIAKIIGKGGISVAKLIGTGTLAALKTFGSLALTAGKFAGNFGLSLLKMGANALVAGARMAAAWVIGLGPIGWIIIGVIALVALLVAAWKNDWGHIREHTATTIKWITDHFNAMIEWFKELPGKMKQFGIDIVTGLWNGITSLGSWLKDKVSGWIKDVLPDVIREKLGISSPSRLMREYGTYTAQGLALGITDNSGLVKDATGKMVDGAMKQIKNPNMPKLAFGAQSPQVAPQLQSGAISSAFSGLISAMSGARLSIKPFLEKIPNLIMPGSDVAIRQQVLSGQWNQTGEEQEAEQYQHVPAMARSGGGSIDQSTNIEKGAIVVHAAPNQSTDDIAEKVLVKIQRKLRNKTWSRPTPVIPGVS